MANIIIRTYDKGMAQIRTSFHDSIYDYMREIGFDHDAAEGVASWAKDAPVGSKYVIDGADIQIV